VNDGKAGPVRKRRFEDAFHHILNNAAFPKPVIAMNVPSGLTVLDGSHRVAAFCTLQMMPDAKFESLKLI
jgi:NAD(P)H-hydrate repair Nnr-like enzyme with NAD(P)H-hydrate epimerase domain